jgi:aldose 1-epimerase
MGLDILESPRMHLARDARELLALRAGELHLVITPDVGGSIASFSRRWTQAGQQREVHWLRPASAEGLAARNPLAMASFPLVPFCNRIRNGRASFGGRDIRFPPNHPAEDSPHPLHGIGWQRPWHVVSAGPSEIVLSLDVEGGAGWPWSFSAMQAFRLLPDRLEVEISVTNEDSAEMPAGIGHHPYFLHEPGTRLATATQAMWQADGEVMPLTLAETPEVLQLRQGTRLSALHTDNNFTGWSRQARIDWPADAKGPARSVVMQADAPLDYFVLYCQRGYDFFCAEPVSQCTDWLNLMSRYGRKHLGGASVAPGETLAARFTLTPRWD